MYLKILRFFGSAYPAFEKNSVAKREKKIEEVPIAHVVVASRGYRDHRACC